VVGPDALSPLAHSSPTANLDRIVQNMHSTQSTDIPHSDTTTIIDKQVFDELNNMMTVGRRKKRSLDYFT